MARLVLKQVYLVNELCDCMARKNPRSEEVADREDFCLFVVLVDKRIMCFYIVILNKQ